MKRYKSDIPEGIEERLVHGYKRKRTAKEAYRIQYRVTECVHKNQVVGQRVYRRDGTLVRETPLKYGQKHGREFTWDEEGRLESIEPYFEGKIHGTAKQYNRRGRVIGTYQLVHGTGYDIWWSSCHGGPVSISEIFAMRDGLLHGYEWWVNADQRSVWHERHWYEGQYHGIERMWNQAGKLKRGYPKYWIRQRCVTKRRYLQARRKDKTLPVFRATENLPRRRFPDDIEQLIKDQG